jgi:hypothetical protein
MEGMTCADINGIHAMIACLNNRSNLNLQNAQQPITVVSDDNDKPGSHLNG